jgi:hypothetical protein
MKNQEVQLAADICNCPRREMALTDKSSPCHKVVKNQLKVVQNFSDFHRPEPWIGRLSTSKLLFISSNPGLSIDQGPEREEFPTQSWSPEDAAEFFVERFNQDRTPVIATFNNPVEPDFLTRSADGLYRSGGKNPRTPQRTWSGIHRLACEVLGQNCSPDSDYALTEIVHCKSQMGAGVEEASDTCADTWMMRIINSSQAKVLVVIGAKVRDNFAIPFLGAPANFAESNGASYKAMTAIERARRDIFLTQYGVRPRLVLFNWHPTSMEIRGLENVYGEKVVTWVSKVISGTTDLPKNNTELQAILNQL